MAASTPTTLASLDAILQELSPAQAIYQMGAERDPIFGLIKTRDDFYGITRPVPVQYGSNQQVGAKFTTAQENAGSNSYSQFTLDKHTYYGFVRLARHAIEAAKENKGAFIDAMKAELDGTLTTLWNDLAFQVYGDGTGDRGLGTFSGGSTSFTLTDLRDAFKFYPGMYATCHDPTTYAKLGTSANGNLITAVNPATGVITGTLAWDNAAHGGLTAGTRLMRAGDTTGTTHDVILGLQAWIPYAAPTATTFLGVARNTDPIRLAGHRFDGSVGYTIDEAFLVAHSEMAQYGGAPKVGIVNTRRWSELIRSLDAALVRQNMVYVKATNKVAAEANIGYEAVNLVGHGHSLPVIASPFCPYNYAYLLNPAVWTLDMLGKAPAIIRDPENKQTFHRDPLNDGLEARLGWIGNFSCSKPLDQCVIKLA